MNDDPFKQTTNSLEEMFAKQRAAKLQMQESERRMKLVQRYLLFAGLCILAVLGKYLMFHRYPEVKDPPRDTYPTNGTNIEVEVRQ